MWMSGSVSSQKCFQTNLECRLAAAAIGCNGPKGLGNPCRSMQLTTIHISSYMRLLDMIDIWDIWLMLMHLLQLKELIWVEDEWCPQPRSHGQEETNEDPPHVVAEDSSTWYTSGQINQHDSRKKRHAVLSSHCSNAPPFDSPSFNEWGISGINSYSALTRDVVCDRCIIKVKASKFFQLKPATAPWKMQYHTYNQSIGWIAAVHDFEGLEMSWNCFKIFKFRCSKDWWRWQRWHRADCAVEELSRNCFTYEWSSICWQPSASGDISGTAVANLIDDLTAMRKCQVIKCNQCVIVIQCHPGVASVVTRDGTAIHFIRRNRTSTAALPHSHPFTLLSVEHSGQ